MVSRMKELEQLTLKGRKPTSNIFKALQRRLAGKDNLTNTGDNREDNIALNKVF